MLSAACMQLGVNFLIKRSSMKAHPGRRELQGLAVTRRAVVLDLQCPQRLWYCCCCLRRVLQMQAAMVLPVIVLLLTCQHPAPCKLHHTGEQEQSSWHGPSCVVSVPHKKLVQCGLHLVACRLKGICIARELSRPPSTSVARPEATHIACHPRTAPQAPRHCYCSQRQCNRFHVLAGGC